MQINTQELTDEKIKTLTPMQVHWVYNALDCCGTSAILPEIEKQLTPGTRATYELEKALQAPMLEASLHGLLVDESKRAGWARRFMDEEYKLQGQLDMLATAVWGKGLNPNSVKQMREFFYGALKLPPVYKRSKSTGKRELATDRDTLEKLENYFYAKTFVKHVQAIRDAKKKLSVLRYAIDTDGVFRTSFNIAGTETGRFSSSPNAFRTGASLQNITYKLREIFVARPGHKYAYIDLDHAESDGVAYLSGDEAYIEACGSGDPHTIVTKMVWPNLDWTGRLKEDKAIAETVFYRWFTHRDMAKRGGHGTNYYGTPKTMAAHLKVPAGIMEKFQAEYFRSFPNIKKWHSHVAMELQTKGVLRTPFGRERTFFGRLGEDKTLREAIAFVPQSTIADYMNTGLLNVWRRKLPLKILLQVHDAILIEYPDRGNSFEWWLLNEVQKELTFSVPVEDIFGKTRDMKIGTGAEVGWNWSKYSTKNPDGLKGYSGKETRKRHEQPKTNRLDK